VKTGYGCLNTAYH